MSKLNSGSNKDNLLNSRVKSRLDGKNIKKIRKELLSLTKIDIKTSKRYNIIIINEDENEDRIVSYNEDFERINQNEINIENETNFDPSELADSSDFENEEDDF